MTAADRWRYELELRELRREAGSENADLRTYFNVNAEELELERAARRGTLLGSISFDVLLHPAVVKAIADYRAAAERAERAERRRRRLFWRPIMLTLEAGCVVCALAAFAALVTGGYAWTIAFAFCAAIAFDAAARIDEDL